MDYSKIFLKDACPTSIGGQAVMEGVMMKGKGRTAIAVRIPDGRIHIKTMKNKKAGVWSKIPIIRGVISFITSLVGGMKCLLYSADVAEHYMEDQSEIEEEGRLEKWFSEKFGEKAAWNIAIFLSVIFSLVISIAVFVIFPTLAVSFLKKYTESDIMLNLAEGLLRIMIFLLYIVVIRKSPDIKRVFEYHGAEHKTIHCFENGLELNTENAQQFYTLHPRCGTSFLMFVMIISLILFSLLGWPGIVERIVSRLVLIPVVAGLSYELLRWAGKSDNVVVRVLSIPGLYLQKLTTAEPDDKELAIGITSMKAVLVDDDADYIEGICNEDAELLERVIIENR